MPGPQAWDCFSPLCGRQRAWRKSAWPRSARSARRWPGFIACERQIRSACTRGRLASAGRRRGQHSRSKSSRCSMKRRSSCGSAGLVKEEMQRGNGTCCPAKLARSLERFGSDIASPTTPCWNGQSSSDRPSLPRASETGLGVLSWRRRHGPGLRALTGYSHGAAGAGAALLELGAAVCDETFKEAGLAAFAYERRWYNAAQANWPDFRRSGGARSRAAQQFSTAWCHGAPGIALSRLRALQLAPFPEIASELHAALDTTRRATAAMLDAPGTSFCLCHGLTGNAEVLNLCSDGTASPLVWRVAARCRRAAGTETSPSPDAAPGLMLGRSGIELFYLRLFDPSLPSVLLPYP